MKYCGKCGTANDDEMNFCVNCGTKLNVPSRGDGYMPSYKTPVMETKIVQVDNSPSVINASNEIWGAFGWNVQNVQVTHSQDTKTYTKGFSDYYLGTKTVETTTINYATITYQRDKNMDNYAEIVRLENEYDELNEELTAIQMQCTSEPFNVFRFVLGILFSPIFGGYYKEWKEQKKQAEIKYNEYSRSGTVSEIKKRKEDILRQVNLLL